MVISNAKYEKKHGGTKNRAYLSLDREKDVKNGLHTSQIDWDDFEIPLYQEMKFLRLEDMEE